jgi:hypothetical protein
VLHYTRAERFARDKHSSFLNLRVSYEVNEVFGANVIKLFTAVIYHHSMVILTFCVIKLYYLGNYCGMAVNYHGILTVEKVV